MGMGAMTQTAGRQDAAALASAAAGDEIAFRRIIAAHHEDMRRICLAISSDEAIADEAVEAAWVIAWKKLSKVRGPEKLRPWLVSVVVKEAKQLLRKRQRHARMEVASDPADAPGGIDPATGIAGVDLRAALLRLGPDDRALLVMRYGAGFDSTELAAATGKTPAAIRQRLKRLTDRLREDLSDD
jgi:RNA polymerase sigma-70 factor (ECF subfamily)